MKRKLLLIVLLFQIATVLLGQSKKETALFDKFWKSDNAKARVTDVPEKWNNESSVMLFWDEHYKYVNTGKKMKKTSSRHFRVKLLDQVALDDYSSLSLDKDSKIGFGWVNWQKNNTVFGVKIIKADGREIIVDTDEATVEQDKRKKIAIPGLEIGDIIDFFFYSVKSVRTYGFYTYTATERVLTRDYPVLYNRVAVEVENDFYLNMQSFNGAPVIKEETTDKRRTRRYVLEANDIEKADYPRWFYPFAELPAVKFQVNFVLKKGNRDLVSGFISDDDAERKFKVSPEEVLDYYNNKVFTVFKKMIKAPVKYIKKKGITDKREQVIEALYYARHHNNNRSLETSFAYKNKLSEIYLCEPYVGLKGRSLAHYMAGIAKKLDIDYDVIVAKADFDGSLDDLLLKNNLFYGLRFNFSEPIYIFNLWSNVQPDYLNENYEGVEAYVMSVKKNKELVGITKEFLPVTTADENMSAETIKVDINSDFKTLSLNRSSSFTGHFKIDNFEKRIFFGDFIDEEYERYGSNHFYHCKKNLNKKDRDNKNKIESLYATERENNKKGLVEYAESNFDSDIDNYDYEVSKFSRYSNGPLVINDSFDIEGGYLKKAGNNYILSLGKLMGGQVNIAEDEMERTATINIDHAKTFQYEVRVAIPEGYTAVGLEKFKSSVSNSTGSFVSEVVLNGNELILKTKKVYNKRKFEAEYWDDMVSWLKAGYDLSQEKILLKKN